MLSCGGYRVTVCGKHLPGMRNTVFTLADILVLYPIYETRVNYSPPLNPTLTQILRTSSQPYFVNGPVFNA
jgi:hypothetical protein